MKTKFFTFFVALFATTCLWAYDFKSGDLYYNITSNVEPYTVEVTRKNSYSSSYDLTSVTIPSTVYYGGTTYAVTSIGEDAFYNCYTLTSITIGNNVTTIGEDAFYYCSALTKTNYTGNVAGWCDINFESYSSNPMYYSHNFYINDQEIKDLVIPNTVDSIHNYAFYNCDSLASVTIGESVIYIGNNAFSECSALTSITWNAKKCADFSYPTPFNGSNSQITSFTFGEKVEYIPAYLCDRMDSLTSITIPNSVTSIGSRAFSNCSALTKTNYTGDVAGWCDIKFGNTVSNPMYYSHNFYINDQEIKDLVIPNTVDSIHKYAFYDCSSLTSISIPNSVTSIGNNAFCNCYSLTSLTIPNSVTNIAYDAFYNCCFLKKDFINNSSLDAEKYNYWGALVGDIEEDGLIISGTTVVWGRKHLTDVTIPNYITTIGEYAFYNCSTLTSVTIGENVTSIGNRAFYDCSALTSITIGNSVTSIGNYAFNNCSSLTSITIPNSVTSIGNCAFNNCSSLTSITIGNSVTSIGYGAFEYTGLYNDEANWENGILYIDRCLIESKNYSIESCTIRNDTRLIADHAFKSHHSLTSVTIPNSVISIGKRAFYLCWALSSVTILDGVVNIGELAFCECPITSVTIPNSVKNIGERAFCGCSSLISIVVESGNSTYDSRNGCNAIIETATNTLIAGCQNTIIPNTVTSIGRRAFQGCSSLTTITIPNSVSNIGSEAFGGCSSLTSVFVESLIPPKCNFYSFPQLPSLICYIPCGTKELYKQTYPWDRLQISHYEEYSPLIYAGICGSNVTWEYNHGEISVQGTGQLIGDCMPWEPLIDSITSVNIANGITHIPENAFADCKKLTKITLPNSLEEIGKDAFANCRVLYDIYCYATMPPLAVESSFTNYNAYVYIPCESQRFYQADMVWSEFKNMQCISSDNVSTDGVVITPTTNDVTITWPTENNAETYTLVIKKGDEVFCNLTFNADGQLLNISFAPSRDRKHHPVQHAEQVANGYRFTVTGLEEGTDYTYSIDVKDTSNQTIKSYSGEFSTQAPTAVEDLTTEDSTTHKLLRDGQLLILRDGKTYNVMGQEL